MSLPECCKLNQVPIVASNFDHSEIASKSGKAPPNPPARIIKLFFLKEPLETVANTVPTAIPVKVWEMMSKLFC